MGSISEADTDVHTRMRQQEVVAELGQQALECDDLDQLMHDASDAVAETLGNEYAKVLELLPGGDEVLLRQGVGWRDGLVGSTTVPTDLDSQAGYTLLSEEPIIVDDLRTEDRFSGPELLTSHDVVSGISVVIGSVENPWGVLGTHTSQRRDFTKHDANFVQSVANVLASAISRHRNERELDEQRERYRRLLETSPAAIAIFDATGRIRYANDAAAELSHVEEPEDLLDRQALGFVHPDDRAAITDRMYRVIKDREATAPRETKFVTPGGDIKHMTVTSAPITYNGEPAGQVVLNDVTERKEHEQELELFRALLDHSTDSVFVIDPETGQFLDANDTACRRLGYEHEELLERSVPDIERGITTCEDWQSHVDDVQTRGSVTFDGTHERKDGTTYPAEVNVAYVELERAYMLAIARDVTERKEYEQKLEESNERLEQFAYAVSHDLQEPLRMVSSYLQLIERRYADEFDEDGREFIDFAVDGADRMREMIQGLLAYSRVDTRGDPFEPVALDVVFADVRDDLQVKIEEHDAEISVAELPRVEGDVGQLRQLFQNLLSNAIEYSGDAPPSVSVTAERDGSRWVISVRDEGIGIDPEDQDRIFEVFQRLHTHDEHDGTGIGLALCERIVDRHGGEIWVDSEPGEGSTFSFTLPAADRRSP